jgi:hypothetical protein
MLTKFNGFTTKMTAKVTTAAGFEPALPKGNALAGHRLNRSAKLSHFLECRMLQ